MYSIGQNKLQPAGEYKINKENILVTENFI